MKGDERILSLKQAPEGILLQFDIKLLWNLMKVNNLLRLDAMTASRPDFQMDKETLTI